MLQIIAAIIIFSFFFLHSIMFIRGTVKILSISVWLFIDIAHHVWNCWKVKNYTTLYGYNNREWVMRFFCSQIQVCMCFGFDLQENCRQPSVECEWKQQLQFITQMKTKFHCRYYFDVLLILNQGNVFCCGWSRDIALHACTLYKLHVVIVNDLCFINYFECHANISIFLSAIEFFLKKKKLIVHFNTTMAGLHFPW